MYIKYYVFKQFVIPVNAVKMNIKAQKIGTVLFARGGSITENNNINLKNA